MNNFFWYITVVFLCISNVVSCQLPVEQSEFDSFKRNKIKRVKILEWSVMVNEGQSIPIQSQVELFVDTNGVVIKSVLHASGDTTSTIHYYQDHVLRTDSTFKKNLCLFTQHYFYNENHKLTSIRVFDLLDKNIYSSSKFYCKRNSVEEIKTFGSLNIDATAQLKITYKLNRKGLLVKETHHSWGYKKKETFLYSYNKKGLLIKRQLKGGGKFNRSLYTYELY